MSPAVAPRITVTYQDADIRDVVAAFAAFSGRTIVAGKDVAGTVTAEIRDQPWDVALRSILSAHGMAATEEASGIIAVSPRRASTHRNSPSSKTPLTPIEMLSGSEVIVTDPVMRRHAQIFLAPPRRRHAAATRAQAGSGGGMDAAAAAGRTIRSRPATGRATAQPRRVAPG